MTSILQPLDRCIHFPFKMNLKKKYTDYILNNITSNKETMMEARKRIVQDILEIWKGKDINNNKEYNPASLKIKSFK